MKHGLLKKCVLLLLGILLSSCASAPYNIQNQTAIPKNLYKTYNKYYISWLDLGKDDWKKYNYPSQKEWEEFIYDGNINGLRVWMKDKFRGKELR